jgi:hypothetical protein
MRADVAVHKLGVDRRIDMRRVIWLLTLAAVGIGSFGLTLWATAPRPSIQEEFRSDVERLASYGISGRGDLVNAVMSIGLYRSDYMAANIDAMRRINDREVAAHGWLADPGGDATPLKLLVFVAGKLAVATETQGERPDVAREHALTQGAEKNVSFQANFDCAPGQQPVIIGLGLGKSYVRLNSPPCP